VMASLITAIGAYLIGSVPSGYIAGRIAGVDIRKAGSGNIGATNVTRTLGKAYGYPVFVVDFGKGLVAVLCAKHVPQWTGSATVVDVLQIIAGVGCVLGNAFPVWLSFRGGKGVAVSAGVIFGLMPWAAFIVMLTWLVTFYLTRYVSLASVVAALVLPIAVLALLHFQQTSNLLFFYVALCLTAVMVLRHRSNMVRLFRGTEPRFRKGGD
jgi:acyl phosphate:glycerol-3-phosphate acyltransferase